MRENNRVFLTFSVSEQCCAQQRFHPERSIPEICIAALFAFALVSGFCAVFAVDVSTVFVAAAAVAAAMLLHMVWGMSPGKALASKAAFLVLPCIAAAAGLFYTKNGLALLACQVSDAIGAYRRVIYLPFEVTCQAAQQRQCITWVCILMAVLAAGLSTWLVKEHHRMASAAVVILFLLLHSFFGNDRSVLYLFGLVFCLLFIAGKGFLEERLTKGAAPGVMSAMLGLLFLITAATAACLWWLVPAVEYQKQQAVQEWSEGITGKIEEWRYGDKEARAMPLGDFRHLANLTFSDETMLEITAEEQQSLYLRGFTGGEYTGDGWKATEGTTLYQNADEFYWLHQDGFYGQSQIAKAALSLEEGAGEQKLSMTVRNVGADRRFYYTPYEATAVTAEDVAVMDSSVLDDGSFYAAGWSGSRTYRIASLTNQVKRYPALVAAFTTADHQEAASYSAEESHYNAFVYSVYTALPEETEVLLRNHLGESSGDQPHPDYKTVKENVLNYLGEQIKYSQTLQPRSDNTDFLEDLLEISKSGYSVHYATAAALMFRYYGIPARYVEGYLITPQAAEAADGTSPLIITDQEAHAWMEYYQDGIGWIPFEVTPPYLDLMEQPESLASSGAGGTQGNQGDGQQAMEMVEDNYEPEEPERDRNSASVPWNRILLLAGIVLVLAAMVLLIRHLIRRYRKLKALQASFEGENNNLAVISLFDYILQLQEAMGIRKENGSIYAYAEGVQEHVASDYAAQYRRVARIYQKAAYSSSKTAQEERDQVRAYKDGLLQMIRRRCSFMKRIKLKWISGLY